MFTLQLENESGSVVNINDEKNYVVIDVDGLTPPTASIFTSKSASKRGVKYNGSTINERSISLIVKILGNIEVNRNALYEWVDTEQYVKVRYTNGVKNVYCEGYVEESTADLFTSDEVFNITITCPDPYWKDLQELVVDISTLLSQFTFPFAIAKEGIPFSTLKETNDTYIFNAGAETGLIISIYCEGEVSGLTIYESNDTTKRITFNKTFSEGDTILIDTDHSPKNISLINQDGTSENILKYVVGRPTWFTLKKGNNSFGYSATSGLNNIDVKFIFTNKYLGV